MSNRFLISRLSAIGDVMHTLPVLCALREAFPTAFIAWVVEGRNGELLRGHPALDELIVVKRGWLKSWVAVRELRSKLKALQFDTAIDVQGLTKSAIVSRLSGAKTRIGYAGTDGRELSRWLNNVWIEPTATHVVDRNLELLAPLGIVRPTVRFDLPVIASAEALADRTVSGKFAVINPGAGWKSKLWPRDRFAEVARHLGDLHGLAPLVVWAPGEEKDWAEEIVGDAADYATLAPPTSLVELAAICRRASLFIGSDTGPLHIAAAVGTPCVGLFGPMPAERNGPYGPQHIALQKMTLTGRSRDRRNAGPESMLAITAEEVCQACDQLLAPTTANKSKLVRIEPRTD
jgi:lipopolysaccharide heptosyltransferase I